MENNCVTKGMPFTINVGPDEKMTLRKNPEPCPFCGAQPGIEKELSWSGKTSWAIACNNDECPMESVWGYGFESEGEAIRAWNVRHDSSPCHSPGGKD